MTERNCRNCGEPGVGDGHYVPSVGHDMPPADAITPYYVCSPPQKGGRAVTLTVGSLFSGIGGLDLGLERAGMRVIWQSEINPFSCRVLAKHWPDVPNLGDIKNIDWSTVERPDLICGGYPCQPFSLAGLREGENDPRHLWPHFAQALSHLQPQWALLENVAGHLSMGFGRVLGDLAEIGYDAEWDCIPAAGVGAPHIRDRVFVIGHRPASTPAGTGGERLLAHATSDRQRGDQDEQDRSPERQIVAVAKRGGKDVADSDRSGFPKVLGGSTIAELARFRAACRAGWWDAEPDVGRVADGVPARVDRLRGLGNAVVPQVAEWIGRRIIEARQQGSNDGQSDTSLADGPSTLPEPTIGAERSL